MRIFDRFIAKNGCPDAAAANSFPSSGGDQDRTHLARTAVPAAASGEMHPATIVSWTQSFPGLDHHLVHPPGPASARWCPSAAATAAQMPYREPAWPLVAGSHAHRPFGLSSMKGLKREEPVQVDGNLQVIPDALLAMGEFR